MPQENTVSVIEPDDSICDALRILLETYHIEVESFSSVETLREARSLEHLTCRCLIISAILPGASGISLIQQLRSLGLTMPLILTIDTYDRDFHTQALALGATEVIEKSLLGSYLTERLVNPPSQCPSQKKPCTLDKQELDGRLKGLNFRMMQPKDLEMEQEFIRNLSPAARQFRFFSSVKEIPDSLLYQFTHTVFPDSLALIATTIQQGQEHQVGVARYACSGADGVAEFAVAVDEQWQGQGIASKLLRGLTSAACIGGINRLEGIVLRTNARMLGLAHELGFLVTPYEDDRSVVCVSKDLRATSIDSTPSEETTKVARNPRR